jgi:tungstate transport system substrate-binding protein
MILKNYDSKEFSVVVRILSFPLFFLLLCFGSINAEESPDQGQKVKENPQRELKAIFPVTCVSPGLANGLAKKFETQYNIPVKVISLCTGDAISFIKEHEGVEDIDIMLGHEPDEEAQFIKDGFAVNLRPVCFSDFVLVGPPDDPAKIKGMTNALKALQQIAATKSLFCSRADFSGTHGLEMRLWKMAKITPAGDWYIQTKVGTSETLIIAAKKKAYFISHWASFSEMQETVDLVPLVEDPARLFTNYDAMAINPERFPKANYVSAMLFIGFLTSPEIQRYISEFGLEKYHRPAFIPLAVKTNQQQKEKK